MAIVVTDKSVKQNDGYGRGINQLMEIFINNEMQRRKIAEFKAAIIEIFDTGRDPKIYLNEEAIFKLSFKDRKFKRNDIGREITVKLEEIKSIKWDDKLLDRNSAKIFVIKWNKNYWLLDFDFRYNKATAKSKLERAKEFLSASKKLDVVKEHHVLIYLFWSCAELIIDTKLYLMPEQRPKMAHGDRKEKLQKFGNTSNVFSKEFIELFTTLSKEKNPARYGGKANENIINKGFISKAIATLEAEFNSVIL